MKKKRIVTLIFALIFLLATALTVFIFWRVKPVIGSPVIAPSLPKFEGEMMLVGALIIVGALFGIIALCLAAYITSAVVTLILSIVSLHSSLRCVRIASWVSITLLAVTLVFEVIVFLMPI